MNILTIAMRRPRANFVTLFPPRTPRLRERHRPALAQFRRFRNWQTAMLPAFLQLLLAGKRRGRGREWAAGPFLTGHFGAMEVQACSLQRRGAEEEGGFVKG